MFWTTSVSFQMALGISTYRSLVESTDGDDVSITSVLLLTGNGIIRKGDWGSPSDSSMT